MNIKTHYDQYLLGATLCGLTTYDKASEKLHEVTCKTCIKRAYFKWKCNSCGGTHFRKKENHGCVKPKWEKVKPFLN